MQNDKWRTLLRRSFPDDFLDGARAGLAIRAFDGDREPGNYPLGFHEWPLERRNAWWAGYNQGRLDWFRRVKR